MIVVMHCHAWELIHMGKQDLGILSELTRHFVQDDCGNVAKLSRGDTCSKILLGECHSKVRER